MAKWGEGDPRWIVEERPDATNVNNWHWTEKNADQWSKDKLKELLCRSGTQGSGLFLGSFVRHKEMQGDHGGLGLVCYGSSTMPCFVCPIFICLVSIVGQTAEQLNQSQEDLGSNHHGHPVNNVQTANNSI